MKMVVKRGVLNVLLLLVIRQLIFLPEAGNFEYLDLADSWLLVDLAGAFIDISAAFRLWVLAFSPSVENGSYSASDVFQ